MTSNLGLIDFVNLRLCFTGVDEEHPMVEDFSVESEQRKYGPLEFLLACSHWSLGNTNHQNDYIPIIDWQTKLEHELLSDGMVLFFISILMVDDDVVQYTLLAKV